MSADSDIRPHGAKANPAHWVRTDKGRMEAHRFYQECSWVTLKRHCGEPRDTRGSTARGVNRTLTAQLPKPTLARLFGRAASRR